MPNKSWYCQQYFQMSDTSTTLFLHGLEDIHEITLLGVRYLHVTLTVKFYSNFTYLFMKWKPITLCKLSRQTKIFLPSVPIYNIICYTIGYTLVFMPKSFYLFSYSILVKGFLDICAEGFCIRADFLHKVRW